MSKLARSYQFLGMTSSLQRTYGSRSSPVPCLSFPVACPKVHFSPRLSSPTCGHSLQITTRTSTLRLSSSSISSKRRCSRCSKPSCSSRYRAVIQAQVAVLRRHLQTPLTVVCPMPRVKMERLSHLLENPAPFQPSPQAQQTQPSNKHQITQHLAQLHPPLKQPMHQPQTVLAPQMKCYPCPQSRLKAQQ